MNYRAEPLSHQGVPVIGASVLSSIEHSYCSVVSGDPGQTVISFSLSGTVSFLAFGIRAAWPGNFNDFAPDSVRFHYLVSQWHKERGTTSSITKMAMCPAYQSIIAMGEKAVPLILRQMESEGDEPDMWFWALQVLTNSDPVIDDIRGNFKKMAEAWFDWAYELGYVW